MVDQRSKNPANLVKYYSDLIMESLSRPSSARSSRAWSTARLGKFFC
jgi:hypothetical protein